MPERMPPDLEPEERALWDRIAPGMRGATAACPDPHRLRAFLVDALPPGDAGAIEAHLGRCRICRTLRDSLAALEPGPLAAGEAERIRARVSAGVAASGAKAPPRPSWRPLWRPALLVAVGVVFAMVASILVWRLEATRLSPAQVAARLPAAPAALAVFHLDKPPVMVPAALVWRGAAAASWQAQSEAGLHAYRDGRYAAAAAALQAVAARFPRQPEPLFYLGISRLILGQNTRAAATLARAQAAASGALAQNAEWYRAIALIRGGLGRPAVPLLRDLCGSGGLYATRACQGERALAAR